MKSFFPDVPDDVACLSYQEMARLIGEALLELGIFPQVLDRRAVGTGKTEEYLDRVVQIVPLLPAGEVAYIFAPTTILCAEIESRLVKKDQSLADDVLVYRGRTALVPNGKDPMCTYHAAAAAVSMRGGDPYSTLCKSKSGICQYFETCAYLYQRKEIRTGQYKVIIMPHAMLPMPPRKGMGKAVLVINDEDPAGALIDDGSDMPLYLDELANGDEFLTGIHSSLLGHYGAFTVDLNSDEVVAAIKRLHEQVREGVGGLPINPTATQMERYIAATECAVRGLKIIRLLKAILRSRQQHVLGCRLKREGSRIAVTVRLKKHIHAHYADARTLILSATASPEVLRYWWSRLKPSEKMYPKAEHEQVIQYVVKATKTALGEGKVLFKQVVAAIHHYATKHRGEGRDGIDGLVVCQLDIEKQLRELVPDNIALGHFNALAGINDFEGVRFQMIVGRPMPHPDVIELEAEVTKGSPVARRCVEFPLGWYPKRPIEIGGLKTMTEWHPDPIAYAVLKAKCHGQVEQANRARGIRRTAQNPVTSIYIGSLPAPVEEIDEVHEGLPFGPKNVMVERGLVIDASAKKGHWKIISKVVPEWFETEEAARMYFRNAADDEDGLRCEKKPSNGQTHIKYLYGFDHLSPNGPHSVPFKTFVHAKVTLEGQRYGTPVFIDLALGEAEEYATQLLGPLKRFEVLK